MRVPAVLLPILLFSSFIVPYPAFAAAAASAPPFKSPFPINLILSDECLDEFVFKRNLFHTECLKKTISKGLGYAIVMGAGILKVPMILNVVKQKSGLGLSLSSLMLESSALSAFATSGILKKLPFSIWGETLIIAVQNLVLIWLTEQYDDKKPMARRIGMVGVIVITFLVTVIMVPASWSNMLVGYSTICALASRLQQITENLQRGHTGVLSIITQGLILVGALARLGTVLVETSDFATTASLILGLVFNGILLGQVLWYWDASKAALALAGTKKRE